MSAPAAPADPPDAPDPPGHARDWSDAETARFAARHHLPGAGHRPQREADQWSPIAEAAFLRRNNIIR